jgi:5-methylcytosine-specific restriction protein A
MPPRIPKPCRVNSCSQTTTDRTGYCDSHADKRTNWAQHQNGKSDTQRGYGWAWRKLRKQILERDSHLCQECLRAGRVTQAATVDHITPKSQGGTNASTNLQSLCDPCHKTKTATERSA